MNRTNRDHWGIALVGLAIVWLMTAPALLAQDPTTTAPSTAPTTAPATAPAADTGPATPTRNRAWVSGTILNADGKPAAGVVVRVEKQEPMGMGGAGGGKDTGPRT